MKWFSILKSSLQLKQVYKQICLLGKIARSSKSNFSLSPDINASSSLAFLVLHVDPIYLWLWGPVPFFPEAPLFHSPLLFPPWLPRQVNHPWTENMMHRVNQWEQGLRTLWPFNFFRLVHFWLIFIIRKKPPIPSEPWGDIDGKDGTREVWTWEAMLLGQWGRHLKPVRTLDWPFLEWWLLAGRGRR